MKVLIVEDEPDVAVLLARRLMLERPGWEIRTATDEFHAISTVEMAWADIVVLDLWLTRRGFSLNFPTAVRIMDLAKGRAGVVVMSAAVGFRQDERFEQVVSAADAVLRKTDVDKLESTIEEVYRRRQAAAD